MVSSVSRFYITRDFELSHFCHIPMRVRGSFFTLEYAMGVTSLAFEIVLDSNFR